MNFQDYNFKYYKRLERPTAGSPSTKYYMDSGYIVPSCVLTNGLYIIPYKNLWITICYYEDAKPSGMSCSNKYSMDTLSNEHKEYLAGFHNRALAAIGIGDTTNNQPMSTATHERQISSDLSKKIKKSTLSSAPISDDISFLSLKKQIPGRCLDISSSTMIKNFIKMILILTNN